MTWLWTTTFGMPGIAPVMMSSRLGLVAEVMATESPSQERPTVTQRTCAVIASVVGLVGCELQLRHRGSSQQIRGSGSPTS